MGVIMVVEVFVGPSAGDGSGVGGRSTAMCDGDDGSDGGDGQLSLQEGT